MSGPQQKQWHWAHFLAGKWLRSEPALPTKPGRYFVATRDGTVSLREYRLGPDRMTIEPAWLGPRERWMGWVWSQPIPDCPNMPVPDWDEEQP